MNQREEHEDDEEAISLLLAAPAPVLHEEEISSASAAMDLLVRSNPQEDAVLVGRRPGTASSNQQQQRRKQRNRKHSHRHRPKKNNNYFLCFSKKSTSLCMNTVAKVLVYLTIISLACAVVWYSTQLYLYGTDAHYIAWFSAGAFVLLGFPISMYGIVSHLFHYNQPHVQVYVVRILWMVPIYSIESWLAMRFHTQAIYIETLRDLYESYVLYSFTQFLIQVLGGEEALILLLKDKSPTRGVHMWGLQWCCKPWLMGQPTRQIIITNNDNNNITKRIQWTSPFFVKCKFGVLQYVLLKFILALATVILERLHLYKEGNFTFNAGYLYVCILTNASQCWALYCLIFFYYATKNELAPIRPVGKFLAVKALVFFTWWQSVMIMMLQQMDMIPNYIHSNQTWSKEDVAKAIQDYLICVEMFVAAVVHSFVFPHTEYSPQAVEARTRSLHNNNNSAYTDATTAMYRKRLLGRKHNPMFSLWKDDDYSGSGATGIELQSLNDNLSTDSRHSHEEFQEHEVWEERQQPKKKHYYDDDSFQMHHHNTSGNNVVDPILEEDDDDHTADDPLYNSSTHFSRSDYSSSHTNEDHLQNSNNPNRPGFVRALLDTAIPADLHANTVGIVKGDYIVERKTLLQHASTSDNYDLFGRRVPFKKT